MSALPCGEKKQSAREAIAQWWRAWTGAMPAMKLRCLGEEEVDQLAKDVGVSPAELRALANRGSDGADLLLHRMAALDLDKDEVSRIERRTFQDMQRVCTLCESKRRCARNLTADADSPAWKDYCPNAETLMALNALPWAARREW